MPGTETAPITAGAQNINSPLVDLAPEMMQYILAFLSPEAIAAAGGTCRTLHANATDNVFWKEQLKQFSLARYEQLEAQQPQSADAPSDDNDTPDNHSEIDYRAEFMSLRRLVNDEASYEGHDSDTRDLLMQVKKGELDAGATKKIMGIYDNNFFSALDWAIKLRYQHLLNAWFQDITRDIVINDLTDFNQEVGFQPLLFWIFALNQKDLIDKGIISVEQYKTFFEEHAFFESKGSIALHWAARQGHTGVVKALTAFTDDAGKPLCNINARISGDTALREAAIGGHFDAAKALLALQDDQGKPIIEITEEHRNVIRRQREYCFLYRKDSSPSIDILKWHEAASSSNFDTPRKKAMAVFATEKTFKPLVTFGFKSKNIFREIYEALRELKYEPDVKALQQFINDKAGITNSTPDKEKLDNLVAYLNECVFEPTIKAEQAAASADNAAAPPPGP